MFCQCSKRRLPYLIINTGQKNNFISLMTADGKIGKKNLMKFLAINVASIMMKKATVGNTDSESNGHLLLIISD